MDEHASTCSLVRRAGLFRQFLLLLQDSLNVARPGLERDLRAEPLVVIARLLVLPLDVVVVQGVVADRLFPAHLENGDRLVVARQLSAALGAEVLLLVHAGEDWHGGRDVGDEVPVVVSEQLFEPRLDGSVWHHKDGPRGAIGRIGLVE